MAQSVLSKTKVSEPTGRSPFDRSFNDSFNLPAGLLGCAKVIPCVAGTKGRINRTAFTRSAQVVHPAFSRVTEHFDVFKVPMRLLWTYWNDWKLNINDLNFSALIDVDTTNWGIVNSLPTNVPRMDFGVDFASKLGLKVADISQARGRAFNNWMRLMDFMGYGIQKNNYMSNPCVMSLFKLAAYNKVYYDHYRNTAYESNDVYTYNLDWLNTHPQAGGGLNSGLLQLTGVSGTPGTSIYDEVFYRMIQPRYVNYRNDFMHNVYPALNYVVSEPSGMSWNVPSDVQQLLSSGPFIYQPNGAVEVTHMATVTDTGGANQYVSRHITVQNIRAAFALDKLMRASAYAPKHVRDQFKARFGVDVGTKVSNESERLGSFQHDIVFGEVTNTALDPNSPNLGEVGGKGVGMAKGGKPISFYCEEDSLIVITHYFVPRAKYDSYGIDEWNTKLSKEAFFNREFERLGLRPFLHKFISNDAGVTAPNAVVGFTQPNQVYKLTPDLNHGILNTKYPKLSVNSQGNLDFSMVNSPLASFNVHTQEPLLHVTGSTSGANMMYFKVLPQDLDWIFAQAAGSGLDQDTDQFFGDYRIDFDVVAPMDVHGDPML